MTESVQFANGGVLSETESVCPTCLRRVPAMRFTSGDDVFLRKICPIHGQFEVVLWRGVQSYEGWQRPKIPWRPSRPATSVDRGCPFDCGLCPEHRQQTCTALLEVTQRCNLHCSICFAGAGDSRTTDPDMGTIRSWYESILAHGGHCNIQLSGGEPTMRDDLPGIVAMGRALGFGFIQINTNGLRLASDRKFVEKLKEAGLATVFLQFDGMTEDCHIKLRGVPLLELKIRAIRACADHDIGVVLVPTVVPGINDLEIGPIVRFALDNLPAVRGVRFQPVSYFGRFPKPPSDEARITIPEIVAQLETQTHGLMRMHDFRPPGCENAYCSFHGSFVLLPDGKVMAFTGHEGEGCSCQPAEAAEGANKARSFVSGHWGRPTVERRSDGGSQSSLGFWDVILERSRTHMLVVSGMAFQDAWSLDLERLKDCCIHVVAGDGHLVPFCAHNLTGSGGKALYRGSPIS